MDRTVKGGGEVHPFQAQQMALTKHRMILESREAILALAPQLETLAARCQQSGAMHWLAYFLDAEVLGHRAPRLVLFLDPEEDDTRSLREDQIRAAALFFEYELFGLRTGVVATGDAVGFNSVIAPAGERASVAAAASRLLVERGAMVVLATYECAHEMGFETDQQHWRGVRWATRQRQVQRILHLGRTMDDTLATMGKTTRFNLRYYRRRLEKQMPCRFVADAAPLLAQADLQQLNAASLNPVAPEEFARRVASATHLPGSFLCGLQNAEGRWLSLVGGWRQGTTTVLYWQMNSSGLERHSIGTVMRSHFLEHEIGRGARKLLIFGGTPHSMRHAFADDAVVDLVVERTGLRTLVVRSIARTLLATRALTRGNFVLDTVCGPLEWKSCEAVGIPDRPLPLKSLPAERAA